VAQAQAQSLSRAGDLVARYGGEEFAVIQPDTDATGSRSVAETMRRAIEQLRIPHDRSPASDVVTVSLGTATVIPPKDGTPEGLVAAGDEALYRAKRSGRNRVVSGGA
jgi:diguanylate cyclase (GGDEF)-like protein